jgi:hypothetical protein
MMEALSSTETSVLTRAIRHNIPQGTNLHSHRRENVKSYVIFSNFLISERWTNSKTPSNSDLFYPSGSDLTSRHVTTISGRRICSETVFSKFIGFPYPLSFHHPLHVHLSPMPHRKSRMLTSLGGTVLLLTKEGGIECAINC